MVILTVFGLSFGNNMLLCPWLLRRSENIFCEAAREMCYSRWFEKGLAKQGEYGKILPTELGKVSCG